MYLGEREAEDGVPLVVKHMNNCSEKLAIPSAHADMQRTKSHEDNTHHPVAMAREYVLTEILTAQVPDAVPRMQWISGLEPLGAIDQWGFAWEADLSYEDCTGSDVRTVIERRAGPSIREYFAKLDEPTTRERMVWFQKQVLNIGKQLMKLLKEVHATGIPLH